jgi:nitrogenase molybdenum-iron protein alpha/beta subunit
VACLRDDLGVDVVAAILRRRRDPSAPDADPQALDRTFDPSEASLRHHLDAALATGGVDVIVGTARDRQVLRQEHRRLPFVEFGYPQESAHFLAPTPHLGFQGPITWAQRLFDAIEGAAHRSA